LRTRLSLSWTLALMVSLPHGYDRLGPSACTGASAFGGLLRKY
jgi:hypothetical protein